MELPPEILDWLPAAPARWRVVFVTREHRREFVSPRKYLAAIAAEELNAPFGLEPMEHPQR
jgi:hypothetical protein